MAIQFQILGPLEVQAADAPLAIGGPRQRALLAMLLLSANRVVSRDRLIDELLADAPADKAERMLRVQVSRLRGVLDAVDGTCPRLVARSPGYVLRVEPGELDLERFETLLSEGHAALEEHDFERAARLLREAQSTWRGRPLADLEFERFARIDIERLEELRLAALEDLIEAELALGRHAMLIAELEALVAEHPLRERPRGQLMLALYRCGRQADALETYRVARSLLSDELALEPTPALRQLEQLILRQEPALELAVRESESVATELAPPPRPAAIELSPGDRGGRAPPATRTRRAALAALTVTVAAAAAVAVALSSRGSPAPAATADSVGMIDAGSGKLRAVVPAGGTPGGIATGAGAVWETDTAGDLLLEIDPRTRSIERIPVGRGPLGVAVGDGEVWVVDQLDRTVSAINPRSLTAVRSFPVGNGAAAAAFGDGSLWVANTIDATVSRIDPRSGSESTIPLAGQPAGIAVGPGGGVWVTDRSSGQLLLIDPRSNRVRQAQEVGGAPAGVAVGAGSVWVANTAERTVTRFDPGSGAVTNIGVGQAPVGVAYGAGAAWAADSLDGTVARIDSRTGSARLIRIGGSPTAIAALGKQLWTTVLPGHATHLGGTLTMADGALDSAVGDSLDPAEFAGISQWQMLSMTNDGLVTYRRTGGLSGSTLVPDLATGLPTPTDGGRTYTFQLRRGIRYSTGAPVEPADIRRELERVFRLGNGYPQSFYTGIVGGRACMAHPSRCSLARGVVSDDTGNTVTFHLTAPDPDFLYKLAFPWADAVPAGTPGRSLGRSMPPATGPYMTKSISAGRGSARGGHPLAFGTWTLVRNPRFHEWNPDAQPPGYPDKIVLRQGVHPGQRSTTSSRADSTSSSPSPRAGSPIWPPSTPSDSTASRWAPRSR